MASPKVSIIVPVYNVEKYLDKCLDSLVRQTLDSYEVIVVNDGSPDDSQKIIDRYAEKYPEIVRAYNKKNGGLGDARNFGIAKAQGEYVGFVDSDDWVDEKMFEAMYNMAKEENDDIVICDATEINDGWEDGKLSAGYCGPRNGGVIEHADFIAHSLEPAVAWNKLYRKALFHITKFATVWYEDIATTPILLSYAERIGYLPVRLYYYRQREGSIIQSTGDPRTLGVIRAWESALNGVNRQYIQEVQYAVYKSVSAFLHFKPEFAQDFLNYISEKKDEFSKNSFICCAIREKRLENLFEKKLIPKIIHYFWFGGGEKSELIQKCIESWRRNAPDFEIIEWNESNCNMHVNRYVEEAYAAKKWAFVSDYFRMEKIAEHGGIYFDTDVELMRNPSVLLLDSAFFAFETCDAVHAGIFGALPHHKAIIQCQKSYESASFVKKNGSYNTSFTIVRRISKQLKSYGLVFNGEEQVLNGSIRVYPPNKLTLDMFDGEIIAQHHYDCSWWDVKVGITSYKHTVLADYFSQNRGHAYSTYASLTSQLAYYQSECSRYENSTCWRITKPLRMVGDFLKKVFRRNKVS